MISLLIRSIPIHKYYKPIQTAMLLQQTMFTVAFFKQSWRNRQYAITNDIKRCMTSEQVLQIIKANGKKMNIVHLTAILDRIQEESMLNIQPIVQFVVESLKYSKQDLLHIENARALCNIACYLGNLKNTELNHIFVEADYHRILNKANPIETTMLITGLIRLGIFKDIFGIKHEKSRKELLLQDIIGPDFSRNQILSVWYAYISEISRQNEVLNNHLNDLLGQSASPDAISLKTYTYAFICYVRASHTLKDPMKGPLYNILVKQIPLKTKDHLLPYEFSLLIDSISSLKRKKPHLNQDTIKPINFPTQFKKLLISEFQRICQRRNLTLRNVANNFKQFNEAFGFNQIFLHAAIQKVNSIIDQEIAFIKKSEKYEMNYKIDLLSLSSLAWKLGQNFQKIEPSSTIDFTKTLYSKFVTLLVSYMKMLKQKELISKFTTKQLLMMYSGLYLLKGHIKLEFDEEFTQITIGIVTEQNRAYSVKEITLLYTYFKTIKIYNAEFCEFISSSLTKAKDSAQFASNPKAESIIDKKCPMGLGSKCFKCFTPSSQQPELAI